MNKFIGGLAFLLIVGGTSTNAKAAPWCAYYDSSTYNCGFHSYQQCLATISGVGGWCARNTYDNSSRRRSGRGQAR
jgi:hypothetical protein